MGKIHPINPDVQGRLELRLSAASCIIHYSVLMDSCRRRIKCNSDSLQRENEIPQTSFCYYGEHSSSQRVLRQMPCYVGAFIRTATPFDCKIAETGVIVDVTCFCGVDTCGSFIPSSPPPPLFTYLREAFLFLTFLHCAVAFKPLVLCLCRCMACCCSPSSSSAFSKADVSFITGV